MRSLVIGGTSMIGRQLVEQLLARGDDVTILHRGTGTPYGDRVAEMQADRNDPAAVHRAIGDATFDVVFDNVYDFQRGTTAAQVTGTAEATGDARYIFMSSVAVYPPGGTVEEDHPLLPDDVPNPYGVQKAQSERALFRRGQEQGLRVSTLRPAFIYGPENPFDREAFFWDRLVAGRPVILPDDGETTMQWIHAADVARAAVRAAERPAAEGLAFNLGGPPITQRAYIEALARAAGVEPRLVPVSRERLRAAGGGLFEPPFYFGVALDLPLITAITDRARSVLDLALIPFADGLRETFAWYAAQERPVPDWTWEDGVLAGAD